MKSNLFEEYEQAVADRHQYAQDWKRRTGGKVIGYLCTYVPEEVIHAMGMLPVRVLGSHEPQDLTDPYIHPSMWCSHCRDCLAQGLQGRYFYLDGLVYAWCCYHIRQTYSSWVKHVPVSFNYHLYLPHSIHLPSARDSFREETQNFANELQSWSGESLSHDALSRAIVVYNTNRRLLHRAYEFRREDPPRLSGVNAMELVLSSMLMDKDEHNQRLAVTLDKVSRDSPDGEVLPRLMLLGSENDDRSIVRLIESLGASVVVDEHCTGSRYFWREVASSAEPLVSIADRYLDRPPCPHKDVDSPHRARIEHIIQLARLYSVQGAILVLQKFCDPYAYEVPFVQARLKEQGIPSIALEVETTPSIGQLRTRVEAFIEMLQ